jgi:polysaccharide export outer membrane protein
MKKMMLFLILCLMVAGLPAFGDESPAVRPVDNAPSAAPDAEPWAARLIRPGDTLKVSVWKYSDLNMTLTVGTDGYISYSYLGYIPVVGKTVEDVRRAITAKLDEQYIANPQVDVQLESLPPVIFVVGEVVKPGSYGYQIGLDPLKAIAMAGGYTDFASRTALIIRRDMNGNETQIKTDLKKLMKANNERDKYILQPGDMVVVKRSWL